MVSSLYTYRENALNRIKTGLLPRTRGRLAASFPGLSSRLGARRQPAPNLEDRLAPGQGAPRATYSFSPFFSRGRTLSQMGEPSKPKAARIWFSKKRSKEKCSFTSRLVKSTKVGGA